VSSHEPEPRVGEIPFEQRSSVAIKMTAKGEATVDVKVYAGQDGAELEQARQLAVKVYNETAAAVRVAA
jgi:hypothetical protein